MQKLEFAGAEEVRGVEEGDGRAGSAGVEAVGVLRGGEAAADLRQQQDVLHLLLQPQLPRGLCQPAGPASNTPLLPARERLRSRTAAHPHSPRSCCRSARTPTGFPS